MKKNWWKIVAVALVAYTILGGFLFDVPRRAILHESIRNVHFHVCMWFAMLFTMTAALVFGIRYLLKFRTEDDIYASEAMNISILFSALGVITGSVWAKFTWSEWPLLSLKGWWVDDVKLNGSAICMLVFLAYLVLRGAIDEEQKSARIAAVYSIFAYVIMIVLLLILPRLTDSLHPGNGGNPGFSQYDLDSRMRIVFYPAIIGWTLLGVWMMQLRVRIKKLERKTEL